MTTLEQKAREAGMNQLKRDILATLVLAYPVLLIVACIAPWPTVAAWMVLAPWGVGVALTLAVAWVKLAGRG